MLPLFLFVVWFLACLVPVLEKKAKRQSGGVTILPGFPVCPLVAWGLVVVLDLIQDNLGYYVIGGLHFILLLWAVGNSARYLYEIKRNA